MVQLPEMGLVQDPRKPCQCSTPCLGLTEASLKTKVWVPIFKKASPTAKWAVYQRTPEVTTLWVSDTHLVSAPTVFSRPMPKAPSSYQHFLPLIPSSPWLLTTGRERLTFPWTPRLSGFQSDVERAHLFFKLERLSSPLPSTQKQSPAGMGVGVDLVSRGSGSEAKHTFLCDFFPPGSVLLC